MSNPVKAATALALAGALAATPVMSQTQTENIVAEQRISVSVRIAPEAAQAFMPAGWTPAGSNLSVIFMDRTLQLLPNGQPMNAGSNLMLVLVVTGRNEAGEVRPMVVGGYSADPLGVPGAYKVNPPGTVSVSRTERKTVNDGRIVTEVAESWMARGEDGASVTLDLAYTRGVPTPGTLDMRIYSGAEPDFFRIYRGRQATEVLRGQGVDRVQSVRLTASGGKLGRAIDGTEEIVSITATPFYTRETFVP